MKIIPWEEAVQIMKQVFPYYESEDRDSYVYLVRKEDIERAAMKIEEESMRTSKN